MHCPHCQQQLPSAANYCPACGEPQPTGSQEAAAKQMQVARRAFRNPNLPSFLRWKYPDETLLERCGEVFPVAVFKPPRAQREDPDSVLRGHPPAGPRLRLSRRIRVTGP
jgi:hypothetical protein